MSKVKQTRGDCFKEYGRVIDMCVGTKVEPLDCLKMDGELWKKVKGRISPVFDSVDKCEYTFAVGICEGKPVFSGDTLYSLSTTWNILGMSAAYPWADLSWTKKTPFKKGQPVMVRESKEYRWRLQYFAEKDRTFVDGGTEASKEGVSSFPWPHMRSLTEEELAEHDRLTQSWRN